MQLVLYTISDSDNVINKTLGQGTAFNIFLKRDTDIINPFIRLVELTGIDYKDFNYAEIPQLNRKYFIRSVESVNASIWGLQLETDVLETYKADILNGEYKIRRPIGKGDYGDLEIDESGKTIVTREYSDVTLEESQNLVMSVIGLEKV